jgi:hypothetical protein
MTRKAPPEIEVKWPGGSFRAAGELALILVAIVGVAFLMMANWDTIVG